VKTLLRSTLIVDPSDNADLFLEQYHILDNSGLGFQTPEDNAIWTFVQDFVSQHHHVPDMSTVQTHFERTRETTCVDRIQNLRVTKPRTRGDFLRHLEDQAQERRKFLIGKLLQEASEITSKGITVEVGKGHKKEKKILQGPIDAVRHIIDGAHSIVTPAVGSKLSGDVMGDREDFLKEYNRVKADPLAGVGQFVGLEQMDDALRGAKKNELWLHAAFTGHMKSSLMLNWAYNQAVYYGQSVLIFSLEMPYHQCRRLLYAMHSAHEKFEKVHPPLDYEKIRDGTLSAKEEQFLKDYVVPDLTNGQYGSIMIEVADPEKIDFTVSDIRSRAETIYAKTPFRLMFVDHALLVAPRGSYTSTTEKINEVIRDCKKMAMGFNKGAGLAVVLLFQISREGYRAALKARGIAEGDAQPGKKARPQSNYVYNLTFLSYANEAERSSDIVTASWIDEELIKKGQVLLQCLKSRDQKPFEPFTASVYWPSRRLKTLKDPNVEVITTAGDTIDIES
jgi:replicative DNA helicase